MSNLLSCFLVLICVFAGLVTPWHSHAKRATHAVAPTIQTTPTVVIVSSVAYRSVVHQIEASLLAEEEHERPLLRHIEVNELDDFVLPPAVKAASHKLYVTVGLRALNQLLETQPKAPILALLLNKNQFEQTLANLKPNPTTYIPNMTALFTDQPLARQFSLLHCLLPVKTVRKQVGLLLGEHSFHNSSQLKQLASQQGIELNIMTVGPDENPLQVLPLLLHKSQSIIALPDETVYNTHTARSILLSCSKQHIPVIGLSKAYVDIGALAAVYSTGEQLAQQAANMALAILDNLNAPLPHPTHPYYFNVAINQAVAQSMGLQVPDSWEIKYALDEMEHAKKVNQLCYQQLMEPLTH
jgi:putative ABC transport system substrate-binding protein